MISTWGWFGQVFSTMGTLLCSILSLVNYYSRSACDPEAGREWERERESLGPIGWWRGKKREFVCCHQLFNVCGMRKLHLKKTHDKEAIRLPWQGTAHKEGWRIYPLSTFTAKSWDWDKLVKIEASKILTACSGPRSLEGKTEHGWDVSATSFLPES